MSAPSNPPPAAFASVGRARDLIRRLGEADQAYSRAAGRLLAPFEHGDCPQRPNRCEQALRRLRKQWAHDLPAFGRLRAHGSQDGIKRLNLGEIRCRATELRGKDWSGSEPGLVVALRSIIVQPRVPLIDSTWNIASIGLHAIACRIERAERHDDAAILEGVLSLALEWPKHLEERPGEFAAGAWRGAAHGRGDAVITLDLS